VLLHGAVDTLEKTIPPESKNMALARADWGRSLLHLKRYSEAEKQLIVADQIMEKLHDPPANRIHDVRADLVAVYAGLKQPQEGQKFRELPERPNE